MGELARTLTDPYFAERVSPERAEAAIALLAAKATIVELTVDVQGVATHPEDDKVLATAASGEASVLCTRDKQLLRLGAFQGVEILSPGELLERISAR